MLQPARGVLEAAGIWDHLAPHAAPLQIMRIVGAFEFLMSFLYLHYIGFPEKHQAGLRVGVMQYALLAVVSLYRVVLEPTSAKNKAVALKSLVIQGAFLGISVVGMLNAPKPPKRKKA